MDQGVMPIRFRYGLGSNPWPLHIAHFCCRSRGRIFVSYRGNAGFVESSGLLGICRAKPVVRLEYVVGILNCTGCEGTDGCQVNRSSPHLCRFFNVAYWPISAATLSHFRVRSQGHSSRASGNLPRQLMTHRRLHPRRWDAKMPAA